MPRIESNVLRMYAGFGIVLVLLVALLGFAFASATRFSRALESNLRAYEAIDASHKLRASFGEIWSGFGGILLGDRDVSAWILGYGEQGFATEAERLARLTRDNPEQQARIAAIVEANDAWRRLHREPAFSALRAAGDAPVDLAEVLGPDFYGQAYVDSTYVLFDRLQAAERLQLEAHTASVSRLQRLTQFLVGVGGAFCLLAAAVFAAIGVRRSRALLRANQKLRQEVSERERAEAALARASRRNALILEAAGEGICGLDSRGRITFLNPAAADMLGVREAAALGSPGHILMSPPGASDDAADSPVYASLRDARVHDPQIVSFYRHEGSQFPAEFAARPILEDGTVTGSVITFRDITDRHAVEKLKDEFISVVSHELRTPLTSIRGSLGLLASGTLGKLEERGQRMLEIAAQNTDRLVRLINDILDIERIESGTVTMDPHAQEADSLIRQAIETVHGVAEKAGVRLAVAPAPMSVWADGDRAVQVLTNLLSNAIKFSEPDSAVSVHAREESGMVRFTVTDRGRGIPADKLQTVFGRFQQVDASDSREKGGTGLGLAIARSIVEQHGGEMWAESELGRGSSFHFTLPQPSAGEDRPRDRPRPSAPHILMCDDDEVTLAVVGEQLRVRGYRVTAAASGASAVDLARAEPPDAILLDLVMPEMDGCETMHLLKRHHDTREIPIIIYSGKPDACDPALAGAVDWVSKNAGEETLLRSLEFALKQGPRIGRVLIVEDDPDLSEVLMTMFESHGVEALHTDSHVEAIRLAEEAEPDMLILDIVLREGSAFGVVDFLRRHDRLRSVPLVVYSALDLDESQRDRLRLGDTLFFTKGRVTPSEFEERVIQLLDDLFAEVKAVA